MRRAITTHMKDFIAIAVLVTIAMATLLYIMRQQGVRLPLIDDAPHIVFAEFSTAQAVTPGQGQTVRVAGVRVGDVAGAQLREGRAIVELEMDPEFDDLVREDATALLRPKTGLKDMFIELNPGTEEMPVADEGFTIPISNTLPDVNPDEVLAGMDVDTRDYIRLLLNGASKGLKDRGEDLGEVLRRFEPTYRDLAAVNTEVATRRRELRRLINSLQRLNTALGEKDDDLAQLVSAANRVFRAIASERENVSETVRQLPPTLQQAQTTLARVEEMAQELRPTAERMPPVFRELRRANREVRPFALEAAPRLRDDIRPFIREARPFVRDLRPAAVNLSDAEPDLTRTFRVINRFFNMLAFNPRGREGPENPNRDEGYLFYSAWLSHQVNHLFGSQDAHGPGRPVTYGGTCAVIQNTVQDQVELEALLGLSAFLTDPLLCGGESATDPPASPLPLPRSERDRPDDEEAGEQAQATALSDTPPEQGEQDDRGEGDG
jgi:phospholipid/cholesterol/gamma-HCH transport system substrate-binding protein